MNRRRFLAVSACAAGALLVPMESVWPNLLPSDPSSRTQQHRRMLHGAAGRKCASYQGTSGIPADECWSAPLI